MYLGNITANYDLSLSRKDLIDVVRNTSTVINSGALVKHFGLKKEFEDTNVLGTENIIAFCKRYGKRLMHISTVSVSGTALKSGNKIDISRNPSALKFFSENNIYIGQDLSNVYALTKFKAEIAVLEAIYDGLDAQVLRLGNITNRYSDGAFQKNANDNAFAKRLKAFIEMGAFPIEALKHELEITPVDLAAEAIVKILNHKSDCNMFHIMDPKLIAISAVVQASRDSGAFLVPLPNQMMADIITGILNDNKRKDIISGIIPDLDKEKNLVYTSPIRLKSEFTEKYLKKCRFLLEKN